MTEEAILADKLAAWRLTSSSSRTSLAETPHATASTSSIRTVIHTSASATAIPGSSPSITHRGKKRKTEEEYKIVPDPAFPTFKELRKLASRESRVKSHLSFITECLEKGTVPIGLQIRIKPGFGQNQPEFLASWNSACNDFSRSLMVMLGERAHTELEALKPQVEAKTKAMNDIIKEKETIDKVADYLQTVLQKDTPEQKKAKKDIPKQNNKRPKYQTQFRRKGQPKSGATESEEDILRLIRQIKQRRRR